jgi:hypothetical protein
MSTVPYYIGAYWGVRPENCEACTKRVTAALCAISHVDDQFCRWFRLGRSRKDALKRPVQLEKSVIGSLLAKGVNRRDSDKKAIPELGFRLALWNGGTDGKAASLSFQCGVHAPRLSNAAVLNLPADGDEARRILMFDKVFALLSVLVLNFDPEWGTVNTSLLRNNIICLPDDAPQPGWLTFISKRLGEVPQSSDYEIAKVEGFGTIIIATREVFSLEKPEHLRSALAAAEAISRLVNLPLPSRKGSYH